MSQPPSQFKPILRQQLGAWFAVHARDLPWRSERTLYRVVVSEFMLQQTQVVTVLAYFARWMQQFPDFEALAAADEAKVLKQWEGLGYYSRARNLHRLAREVAQWDTIPTDPASWQKLPGVGAYTAAAITSQVFGTPAAVVDGNVVRVLSRLQGIATAFKNSGEAVKAITPYAEGFLNRDDPGMHNEALMELGATVCLKRRPLCTVCPLVTQCAAAQSGDPEQFPRIQRPQTTRRTVQRAWIVQNGKLLLQKADASSKRLADFYELPLLDALGGKGAKRNLLATKKRSISNERITEEIYEVSDLSTKRHEECTKLEWIDPDTLSSLSLSAPHRRWIEELWK